jgi:quinoprotein glucose dehydrogenase
LTGLSCKEPPYAGLRAIDLASGATVWDRPLTIPALEAATTDVSGSLLTLGGLVFVATRDGRFRALDATTGATLWRADPFAPATAFSGAAAPFAFSTAGRDHVGVMLSGPEGDYIAVWDLPDR